MTGKSAAGLAFATGMLVAVGAAAGQTPRTQWDGVYTKTQAERGGQLYARYCASCHGADLSGGELAPPLTGGDFNANWNDLTLAGLFDRMRISMPQNNPGSLLPEENAAILAYMLGRGGFPDGSTELPGQSGALAAIKFVAVRPAP